MHKTPKMGVLSYDRALLHEDPSCRLGRLGDADQELMRWRSCGLRLSRPSTLRLTL